MGSPVNPSPVPHAPLPGWQRGGSPFHAGEQAVQARLGVRARMEEIGQRVIRNAMPMQHRELFAQLPFLVVGAADPAGQLQASVLAGPPGFVQSPDDTHLEIDALPPAGDPLAAALQPGSTVGLLGIELPTRRRNRANGRVVERNERGLRVRIEQSFGNCPKYIQRRELAALGSADAPRPPVRHADRLDDAVFALVRRADTFFIASHAPGSQPNAGCDVSHRGGLPGFVQADDAGRTLTWPDYLGNAFFNTLGNLAANGEAALVFPDFETGGLLHVNGHAGIVWDGPQVRAFPGAQQVLRLQVRQVIHRPAALPWRWRLVEVSPVLEELAGLPGAAGSGVGIR
jgi:predicted pyridoxine 5'-phosphate oxidase superfamily flavin-nucleotide-binding protein